MSVRSDRSYWRLLPGSVSGVAGVLAATFGIAPTPMGEDLEATLESVAGDRARLGLCQLRLPGRAAGRRAARSATRRSLEPR